MHTERGQVLVMTPVRDKGAIMPGPYVWRAASSHGEDVSRTKKSFKTRLT